MGDTRLPLVSSRVRSRETCSRAILRSGRRAGDHTGQQQSSGGRLARLDVHAPPRPTHLGLILTRRDPARFSACANIDRSRRKPALTASCRRSRRPGSAAGCSSMSCRRLTGHCCGSAAAGCRRAWARRTCCCTRAARRAEPSGPCRCWARNRVARSSWSPPKAGAEKHPAWFHNVRANPDVAVTVDGKRRPMRARVAAGDERERLWAVVCDHYSGYATYRRAPAGGSSPW